MRLLFFLLFISTTVYGQPTASIGVRITLPSIALLDIAPNNSGINLNITSPTEGGNGVTATAKDNSKWLNFTSAVTAGASRQVSVQLLGSLPNGINLKLTTASYFGSGAGVLGRNVTPIYLTTSQQTVINNIGGAYTGNGTGNGYNLTYSIEISNYSLLRVQTNTLSIVYTLTDN
jgi:hypothetical protein